MPPLYLHNKWETRQQSEKQKTHFLGSERGMDLDDFYRINLIFQLLLFHFQLGSHNLYLFLRKKKNTQLVSHNNQMLTLEQFTL